MRRCAPVNDCAIVPVRPSISAPRDCCAYCGPVCQCADCGLIVGRCTYCAGPVCWADCGPIRGVLLMGLGFRKQKTLPIAHRQTLEIITKKRINSGIFRQSDHL